MLKKLRKYTALNLQEKLILIQAWAMLGWFRAAIACVSLKRLASSLESHVPPLELDPVDGRKQEVAARIGNLVACAARYTPWRSRCLVQVLVTQRLLSARNIPGEFHLGVRKSGGNDEGCKGLMAHAWLVCGDFIVNGESGHEAFTVVSTFSWGQPAQAV